MTEQMSEEKDINDALMNDNKENNVKRIEEADKAIGPQRPSHWKLKFIALLAGMLGLGMCSSLLGPTLPDLQELFYTDTASLSGAITANSLGFLLGSIICGLTFERLSYELQLAADCVLVGVLNLIPPWTGSLGGLISTNVLAGVTRGFYDAAAQVYLLYLLKGHRLQDSSMQVLHAMWSLGATVGPLIIQPFLSSHSRTEFNISTLNLTNTTIEDADVINRTYFRGWNYTSLPESLAVTRVGYAYITLGAIAVVLSSPMWIMLAIGPWKIFVKQRKLLAKSLEKEAAPKRFFKCGMLTLLFFWFFTYIAAESLPINFIATWSLKSLHWPKYTGSLLTSTVFGSIGIGRIIGTPLAAFLSARQMLFSCVTLTTIGYAILALFYRLHAAVIWISLALAGLGMSCSFGAVVMWASRHIKITGPVSAVFLTGNSVGKIISPIPTAYLFQEYSPDWLLYIILIAASLNLIIVVSLELLVKFVKRVPPSEHTCTVDTEPKELN